MPGAHYRYTGTHRFADGKWAAPGSENGMCWILWVVGSARVRDQCSGRCGDETTHQETKARFHTLAATTPSPLLCSKGECERDPNEFPLLTCSCFRPQNMAFLIDLLLWHLTTLWACFSSEHDQDVWQRILPWCWDTCPYRKHEGNAGSCANAVAAGNQICLDCSSSWGRTGTLISGSKLYYGRSPQNRLSDGVGTVLVYV